MCNVRVFVVTHAAGWNVMLSSAGPSASTGGRGFVAKVADFGLSRAMGAKGRIQTRNYGTITHMPPELLSAGTASMAVDVWSFGVLLWQMASGSRPWSGMSQAQVIYKVRHPQLLGPRLLEQVLPTGV
jgi:serine/threonine protein kinase